MILGKFGEQIVMISQKAFDALQFVDSTPAEIYLPKKIARDNKVREEFRKEKSIGTVLVEKYVLDIMREEWKNDDAMQNLGDMVDYAVCDLGYDPDTFFHWFISSGIATQFQKGNPKYLGGMSGYELTESVRKATNIDYTRKEPSYSMSKEKEYWAGWILAYYQWETAFSFEYIVNHGLSLSKVISMYILHEADMMKFVKSANEIIERDKMKKVSKLQQIRKA